MEVFSINIKNLLLYLNPPDWLLCGRCGKRIWPGSDVGTNASWGLHEFGPYRHLKCIHKDTYHVVTKAEKPSEIWLDLIAQGRDPEYRKIRRILETKRNR